jgi:hypothetical protein
MQQELAELRNGLTISQASTEVRSQTSHDEILREIQSLLRTYITTPDPINNLSYADVAPSNQPSKQHTDSLIV